MRSILVVLLASLGNTMELHDIWKWSLMLAWPLLVVLPVWRILKRTGYHGILALLVFVPFVNILCLWLFAFAAWPKEAGGDRV